MDTVQKIEFGFIIVESITIFVQIGLQIYNILDSKKTKRNIIYRFAILEKKIEK